MWPQLLDMTRDESKRILRRVELEAYSSVVSAFRAQGDLTKDKKKMLYDLQQILSISTERHRAEVRRAVNDEKLATIADNMSPSNTTQEWLIEGRRLVPLMPRLVPQTAFTVTANQVANMQAEKNATLPSPSQTGIRDHQPITSGLSSPPTTPWTSRPSSPTSNVVVLPSGMSIHIKGGLNTEEEDDVQMRKRRRSTSTDNLFSPPAGPPIPQVTYTTTMASASTVSPKKITISKSPQAPPRVVASGSQTQKVILVSSQGGHSPGPSMTGKTVTMPVMRSTVSTGTSTSIATKSVILPVSTNVATGTNTQPSNMVTVTTQSYITNTTSTVVSPVSSTTVGTSTTAFLTPTISVSRPRFKTVPRQKIMQVPSPRPGVVIPMSPQPVQPSPQTLQGIKPGPKPTIQIRQEGGMKIITQSVAGNTSKILPKPSQMTTPSGTPVVVVSAGGTSSQTSSVAMVTRTGTSLPGTPAGTKVLNIQTQGGKIITAPRGSSVVTVNPKTLHLTAVKNPTGTLGNKPNVIVVQKTPARRVGTAGSQTPGGKSTTAVISSPFEKELVSFLQKQDPTKQYVVTTTTANLSRGEAGQRKVIVTTSGHGDLAKQISQTLQRSKSTDTAGPSGSSSTILHDLIQAAGIVPDAGQSVTTEGQSGEVTINLDETQLAALTASGQDSATQAKVATSLPSNEWFEYDVTDEQGNTFTHTAESADTAAAIQSLLDMQQQQTGGAAAGAQSTAGQKAKVTVQRSSSVDIGQLSDQLNQQQFYTIEQAMTMLNQPDKDSATTPYIQTDAPEQVPSETTLDATEDVLTAVPLAIPSEPSVAAIGQSGAVTLTSQQAPVSSDNSADLDPQTGMFYVEKGGIISGIKINPDGQQVIVSEGDTEARGKYDLLSSSLAQAQIDLDPFQFIENGSQSSGGTVEKSSGGLVVHKVDTENVESRDGQTSSSIPTEPLVVQKGVVSTPISAPALSQPAPVVQQAVQSAVSQTIQSPPVTHTVRLQSGTSSFVPIQDVLRVSAASSVAVAVSRQTVAAAASSEASIHVTVEPSGLDTSYMKMEDFTSQQLTDKTDFVSDVGIGHMEEIATEETVVPVAGQSSGLEPQVEVYPVLTDSPQSLAGKRKRKVMSGDDVTGSPPAGSMAAPSSWARAALGVLNKVSKYRGVNREKNELNAATWFVQPVDPADAPDYYTIVQNPMDFGTIRKKLELGKYCEFEEFNADMMLVKDNCYLYNPEQSQVRRDCDEVFAFYYAEYEKLLDKWQKTHIGSPVSKKPRNDKSPIRP